MRCINPRLFIHVFIICFSLVFDQRLLCTQPGNARNVVTKRCTGWRGTGKECGLSNRWKIQRSFPWHHDWSRVTWGPSWWTDRTADWRRHRCHRHWERHIVSGRCTISVTARYEDVEITLWLVIAFDFYSRVFNSSQRVNKNCTYELNMK